MTGKNPKRPRDANQLAKRIVDIATGDAEDANSEESVREARSRKAARARAMSLTPEQRAEIAREAASARWKKKD